MISRDAMHVAIVAALSSCALSCTTQSNLVGCSNDTAAIALTNSSGQTLYVHLVAEGKEQVVSVTNGQSVSLGVSAGHAVLTATPDAQGENPYFYDEFEIDCGATRSESIGPQTPVTVTVAITGKGFGEVISDPPGIECSTDKTKTTCTATLAPTQPLRLIAIPTSASTAAWQNCGTPGSYTCDVVVTAQSSTTFTVEFDAYLSTIGVIEEVGSGTVTSTPAGISCQAPWTTVGFDTSGCFALFAPGTAVTLHAEPVAGGAFNGFEGAGCSGTSSDCVITATSVQQNVIAHFVSPQK